MMDIEESSDDRNRKIQIASLIRDGRKRKGLSQEQLAADAGLGVSTVKKIENAWRDASGYTTRRSTLVLIEEVLEMTGVLISLLPSGNHLSNKKRDLEIENLITNGHTYRGIAKRYGISHTRVAQIVKDIDNSRKGGLNLKKEI